jgi:hypothetical protein
MHRLDSEFKKFDEDLERQEKMNLAFIESLPETVGKSVKEMGREVEEGVVPEFIPPEKIKKQKKRMKI